MANFSSNTVKGCSPLSVNFTDNSTGNVVKWDWDLGNGNKSVLKNPFAIYIEPGFYTISLVVEDNLGRRDTVARTEYIEVFQNPVADFSADKLAVCPNELITFENKSQKGTGDINKYTWDFGNGVMSDEQYPTHFYTSSGLIDVTLIVKDVNGCESVKRINRYIRVFPNPEPDFTADQPVGCKLPFEVTFSYQGESGTIKHYLWNFGNGTSSNSKNPTSSYTAKGDFSVRLTVTDTNNCVASVTKSGYIKNRTLEADFSVHNTTTCFNQPVEFSNQSKYNINDVSYFWDFGNGKVSGSKDPSELFPETGIYTVKLIAYVEGAACADTIEKEIQVKIHPKPTVEPVIIDSGICRLPASVFFRPSEPVNKAFWRFSNNSGDTSRNITTSKIYNQAGEYDITYWFEDTNGCIIRNTLSKRIHVESPSLKINGEQKGCIPYSTNYSVEFDSKYPIEGYKWYKDGVLVATSAVFNFTHTESGEGKIEVEIKNNRGCKYRKEIPYSFGEKTNPEFDYSDTVICLKETVYFTNRTDTGAVKVTKNIWKFSEDTSLNWHENHQYFSLGFKDVSLITFNYGCADTLTKSQIIKVLGPLAAISHEFEECSGIVTITNSSEDYTRFRWVIADTLVDTLSDSFVFDMENAAQPLKIKIWVTNDTNRCNDDSIILYIEPYYSLKAAFSHPDESCSPVSLRFTNTSFSPRYASDDRYFWHINGEQVPAWKADSLQQVSVHEQLHYQAGVVRSLHPTFRFEKPGIYRVRLTANRGGCSDTFSKEIIITGPDIDVNLTQDKVCLPVTATVKVNNFDSSHRSYVTTGDGKTITLETNTMNYVYKNGSDRGSYDVYYHLEDSNRCKNWEKFEVLVSGPNVKILAKDNFSCNESKVNFSAQISNIQEQNTYTYQWDMGDGNTANTEEVVHEYSQANVYPVRLTVKDMFDCTAEATRSHSFFPGKLEAEISADTFGSACPPLLVNFYSLSKNKSGVPIKSYFWDFGDSTYSTQPNPKKTYTLPGKYTVMLRITDMLDCEDIKVLPELITVEGPVGEYFFTPNTGCVPLDVTFTATSKDPANTFLWDLGDGSTNNQTRFVKTYPYAGTFTPLLVIADTNGCSYTLPPIGPIQVFPNPVANFVASDFCFNAPTYFRSTSFGNGHQIVETKWTFEDETSSLAEPSYQFKTKGEKDVSLQVRTDKNCVNTIVKRIKIYGFEPLVNASLPQICLGDRVTLNSLSVSDTNIILSRWFVGESTVLDGSSITFFPEQKGWFGGSLYLRNQLMCDTMIFFEKVVLVGDTLPAKPNPMLHVSVKDDHSLQVKYLRSTELDFNKYFVYRLDSSGTYHLEREVKNNTDTLLIIGGLNPLHRVYCFTVVQENICGYSSEPEEADIHCSVELSGERDTNISILRWNAYSGWGEVEKYVVYRQDLQDPLKYDSIGQVPGNVLTYIDSVACFTDLFSYKVKAVEKDGYKEISWSDSCKVNPFYKNVVPPPYILYTSVPDNKGTEMEWLSPVISRRPLSHYILERSVNNIHYTFLDTFPVIPELYYYDNKKKDVQRFNYHYKVKAVDECGDTSIFSNLAKTVLLKSGITENYKPLLYWTKYKLWEEGVAYYIIQQKNPDGSFYEVGRTTSGNDTVFIHHDVEINCLPNYVYRVIAVRNPANSESVVSYTDINSISNETVVPVKSFLYAPNAFSPNADGLNEVLEAKGIYIKEFNMRVYNRWGEKLFDSNDCFATWDGTFMGRKVPQGVYVYIIQATGADGVLHTIKQDVTLLK